MTAGADDDCDTPTAAISTTVRHGRHGQAKTASVRVSMIR
jgi:hypothetical protein